MMERYSEIEAKKKQMERISDPRSDIQEAREEEELEEIEERREIDNIETNERDAIGRSAKQRKV